MEYEGWALQLPPEMRDLCRVLLDGLRSVLKEKLYAVYVYGAAAFPEGGATGDIDFHAILCDALETQEVAGLQALHRRLAREHAPLGGELDGYYILLADARRRAPPRHQWLEGVVDVSWALHRAHILAGRCIVLHGPDPAAIYIAPVWPELEEALQGELAYVKAHLQDYPAYCVLNLCRLIYSFQTGDVVISKMAAAAWAKRTYPAWQGLVDAAERSYDHTATEADEELLRTEVSRLYEFALPHLQSARGPKGLTDP